VSDHARARSGAEFCLCRLVERPVLVLSRGPELRVDLHPWVRYLTDLMPAATAVGGQSDFVPVFVRGLAEDAALMDEAIRTLQEGAHLLSP